MFEIIKFVSWFAFACGVCWKIYDIASFKLYMKRSRGLRFVTLPAHLLFYNKDDDDDEYSDPILAKLKEIEDGDVKQKFVNINYTIDIEQVKSYHEYTMEDGTGDTVQLNCTYATFKHGGHVVLDLPYHQFDEILNNYYNKMYNLG